MTTQSPKPRRERKPVPAKAGDNSNAIALSVGENLKASVLAKGESERRLASARAAMLYIMSEPGFLSHKLNLSGVVGKGKNAKTVRASVARSDHKSPALEESKVLKGAFWDSLCATFGVGLDARATFRTTYQQVLPAALACVTEKVEVTPPDDAGKVTLVPKGKRPSAKAKLLVTSAAKSITELQEVAKGSAPSKPRGARTGTDKSKTVDLDGALDIVAKYCATFAKDGKLPTGSRMAALQSIVINSAGFVAK